MKPNLRRVAGFLALKPGIAASLAMAVLVGMGERMAERFLPVYIIALGGTPLIIGLLNGMDNLLSALYSFPGGFLADRLGYKRALLIFNLLAVLGYSIVIMVPSSWAVIVGAVFFLSWSAISLPATMSLVADVLPQNKHGMGVSMHSMVRRVPMALGPLIGGGLISAFGMVRGVRYAFFAAIGFALLALVIQQLFIREPARAQKNPQHLKINIPPQLRQLLVSDILIRFCEQIPYAFVVVWVIQAKGFSAAQFGLLTAIEMVTAMLIYIPVAWLADRGSRKPYIAITFVNFTLFPLVLSLCSSFTALIFAFILRGLKEFGEPTRKALILDLAPEGAKASTFGTYYLIRDVIVSLAAFGGAFLWQKSPQLNFYTAGAFGLLGTLYFIFTVKPKPLSQPALP
ncbi:MAG: MFS transporter [Candidatus Cloacimonetes bacterium]|nr:MFS transporter [Candidatus Cloacimonadota bacterium]